MTGKQSISFAKAVYIEGSAAIVGEKEKDGPLGEYFSHTLSDPMCGQESWEEGESELQLATAKLAMQKANVRPEQIRMIFAGDLLAQSIASSFGLVDLNCPLYGLFGACSTMGEALSLGAIRIPTVTPQHRASRIRSLRIVSFCSSVKATAHTPWIYDHIYYFSQIVARFEDVVNGVVLPSIMIKSDPAFPSQTARPRISVISPPAISEQTVSPYLQRC